MPMNLNISEETSTTPSPVLKRSPSLSGSEISATSPTAIHTSVYARANVIVGQLKEAGLTLNQAISALSVITNSRELDDFIHMNHTARLPYNLLDREKLTYQQVKDGFKEAFPENSSPDAAAQYGLLLNYYFDLSLDRKEIEKDTADAYDKEYFDKLDKVEKSLGPAFCDETEITEIFQFIREQREELEKKAPSAARMGQIVNWAILMSHLAENIQRVCPRAFNKLPNEYRQAVNAAIGKNYSLASYALGCAVPTSFTSVEEIPLVMPTQPNGADTRRRGIIQFNPTVLYLMKNPSQIPPHSVYNNYAVFGATPGVAAKLKQNISGYHTVGTCEYSGTKVEFFAKDSESPVKQEFFMLGALCDLLHHMMNVPACKPTFSLRRGNVSKGTMQKVISRIGVLPDYFSLEQQYKYEKRAPEKKSRRGKETPPVAMDSAEAIYRSGNMPGIGYDNVGAFGSEYHKELINVGLVDYIPYLTTRGTDKTAKANIHTIASVLNSIHSSTHRGFLSLRPWDQSTRVHELIETSVRWFTETVKQQDIPQFVESIYQRAKLPKVVKPVHGLLRIVAAVHLSHIDKSDLHVNFGNNEIVISASNVFTTHNLNNNRGRGRNNNNNNRNRGRSQSRQRNGYNQNNNYNNRRNNNQDNRGPPVSSSGYRDDRGQSIIPRLDTHNNNRQSPVLQAADAHTSWTGNRFSAGRQ